MTNDEAIAEKRRAEDCSPYRAARVAHSLVWRVTPCTPARSSHARPGSQSPQPHAEHSGDDQRDPAYPMGIVSVPTVTWAWLISRTRCAIAKTPKRTLATRNPIFGEFISRFVKLRDLFAIMRVL